LIREANSLGEEMSDRNSLKEDKDSIQLLQTIARAIDDKKGKNIIILDIRGLSQVADYFVIADGTVDRHLSALSDVIVDYTHKMGQSPLFIEGGTGWLVIDFAGIMVHLMLPEVRERYKLEQLWKSGHLLKVDL
jgi:ribosome-associated protein